jgi:hypothetical protein
MKYEISKDYLEKLLNFIGTLPYAQVKHLFDMMPLNVKLIEEKAEEKAE